MTNQVITEANGGVWTFAKNDSPYNSARVGRFTDLGALMEFGSNPANQLVSSRAGVLVGPCLTGAGNVPNALQVVPSSGLTVGIFAGAAVIERGSYSGAAWSTFTPAGTGPYRSHLRSSGAVTCNAANSLSGTRIDRIDFQLMDGPGYSDNGGTSLAQIVYTPGVVGSGTAANGPANSIPLALITFPAGTTTTVTLAMITDMRRSAGIRGGIRTLLPGDSLSDIGYMWSELRDTSLIATIPTLDRWNPITSAWETVQVLGTGKTIARYHATLAQTPNGAKLWFDTPKFTTPLVTASGTNNTDFAVNKTGSYSVTASTRWGATVGTPDMYLRVGTTLIDEADGQFGAGFWILGLSTSYYMTAGQSFNVFSPSNLATAPSAEGTHIAIVYEGP